MLVVIPVIPPLSTKRAVTFNGESGHTLRHIISGKVIALRMIVFKAVVAVLFKPIDPVAQRSLKLRLLGGSQHVMEPVIAYAHSEAVITDVVSIVAVPYRKAVYRLVGRVGHCHQDRDGLGGVLRRC